MTLTLSRFIKSNRTFFTNLLEVFILLALLIFSNTQSVSAEKENSDLLNSFIQAKGYDATIQFSASNIKQFWVDNSVSSQDNMIIIQLTRKGKANNKESVPLRIQLANVVVSQDCKIEVICNDPELSFTVLDDKLRQIGSSSKERELFIKDTITSGTFHLQDTPNYTFFLQFSSVNLSTLDIKKIILSFPDNKNFVSSPGTIHFTKDNLLPGVRDQLSEVDVNSFLATGKTIRLFSKSKILVTDNTISNSVFVKNTGDEPIHIYVGFSPYTKDNVRIDNRCIPYKDINKVLKVVSSQKNSNKIIVDSYSNWEKGCYLALDAKEDLSDFPNTTYVDGEIQEVNKIDDTHTEVIFDKPIENIVKEGSFVRIQSPQKAGQLYTSSQDLQPGEEIVFSSKIQKDDKFLRYSPKAFCKGTYYVIPFIFSYSLNRDKDNTVLIKNFSVSY